MDADFPRSPPKTLPQDMQRTCSMSAPSEDDCTRFPCLKDDGSGKLSADALALIRGDVPADRKRLLYSNSLRRRSIEVDVTTQ